MTTVSGTVKSEYGVPFGMFGFGAERVWVMVARGGAALGNEGEDLGTKRTVEAGAIILRVEERRWTSVEVGFELLDCEGEGGMGAREG